MKTLVTAEMVSTLRYRMVIVTPEKNQTMIRIIPFRRCRLTLAATLTATFLCSSALADFIISEFLASNSGLTFVDEDNDASDWIEIHNTGGQSASLSGYTLTDDASNLGQWTFPDISIPADGYLVLFASGKDRIAVPGTLHTTFKLGAGGEYLALVDPQETIVSAFAPKFPEQERDISFGVGSDGITRGYFNNPTPGAANPVPSGGGVTDTNFSVQRGLYSAPVSLEITNLTAGSTIRYTTDGSTPTISNGTTYTTPISITGTTVIRAAAFKTGLLPSNVDTQTYLFPSDVRTQFADGSAPAGWPSSSVNGQVYDYGMDPEITGRYSALEMENALKAIPSVMLTTDLENLTGAASGIYSNPQQHGSDWERATHMEIIGEGMEIPVNIRCGLRIRGGASRAPSNPKHSFRVFFDSDYGNPSLKHPLFETEGVDEFRKIDFRTAQNYSWSKDGDITNTTFLRDVLIRDLQAASGQPYTRSRYYHLYLNGVYWGLYMTQERAEANWGESYLGGNDNEFDTLKSGGNSFDYNTEATDGDLNGAWEDLWLLARQQNSNPTTARYLQMQGLNAARQPDATLPRLLDADNLIDYMMVIGYSGAFDNSLSSFVGASNNWYSVRNPVSNDRGFVHLLHDAEHSLGAGGSRWTSSNDRINTVNGAADRNRFDKSNPQFIHMDLAESTPEYRLRFADRARAALFNDGYLTRTRVLNSLEKRRQTVDQVIIAESARWGDAKRTNPADKENWESAVTSLQNLIDTRNEVFVGHLRLGGLYPDTDAPDFSPFSDFILAGTPVNIASPAGIIYYTTDGSDPRQANGTPGSTAQTFSESPASLLIPKNSNWVFNDTGADLGSSNLVAGASGYDSQNWKHPAFSESSWSSGAGILGFGTLSNDENAVTTRMGSESTGNGSNPTTSYLRHKFDVTDLTSASSLRGTLLADDGVIIYINGREVFRKNMPSGLVSSETFATTSVNNSDEITYFPFSIEASSLVEGENVIAVELHQVNANSSDLGFDLTLSKASLPNVVVNSSTHLKARVLNGNEWSALTEKYYSTGEIPQPSDLIVSEVHYHPANPSTAAELAVSADDSDFEFIEITNISSKNLELRGSSLAEQVISDHLEGVRFVFPDGAILAPGKRISIVANRNAFSARYPGTSMEGIGGEYTGNLGNSGEWLQLRNSLGTVLASFRYNDVDPWPTAADGDGMSLQLANLNRNVDYSDPAQWLAITQGGSPSVVGPGLFTGAPGADLDGDGIPAILEYFSGTSDEAGGEGYFPLLWLEPKTNGNHIRYRFVRDPEAINLDWGFQQAGDLSNWNIPFPGATMIGRTSLPNGLLQETYEFNEPETSERSFVRQRVQPAD